MTKIQELNATTYIVHRNNIVAENCLKLSRKYSLLSIKNDYYLSISTRLLNDNDELFKRGDEIVKQLKENNG